MGVIHKLKPEIIDFIIEKKKEVPDISCRLLTSIIEKELKVRVSKSSINTLFKEAGLSKPVGRRQKKQKRRFRMPPLPQLEFKPQEEIQLSQPKEAEAEPTVPIKTDKITSQKEPEVTPPKEPETTPTPPIPTEEAVTNEGAKAAPPKEAEVTPVTPLPVEQPVTEEETKEVQPKEPEATPRIEPEVTLPKEPETTPAPTISAEQPVTKEGPEVAAPKEAEAGPAEGPKEALPAETPPLPTEKPLPQPAIAETEGIEEFIPAETEGAVLLRAADHVVAGATRVLEVIKKRMDSEMNCPLVKVESLFYSSLFELSPAAKDNKLSGLQSLIGGKIQAAQINSFLVEIEKNKSMPLYIYRALTELLEEVRCLKITLSDGDNLFLDGQFHTVWSTPNIPYAFCDPISNLRSCINKSFFENSPLVLFMAPGYDTPTQEFFNLYLGLASEGNRIESISLCGNRLQDLGAISLGTARKRSLIFGLWPWQFSGYRRLKRLGEFKPFYFAPLKKGLHLADIEIELTLPSAKQTILATGCALKTNSAEKIRQIILTNAPPGTFSNEELAAMYLGHWPNLEEAFKDMSRKIELFTYTSHFQEGMSMGENWGTITESTSSDIRQLFAGYLNTLTAYLKYYLLPIEYEKTPLASIKERLSRLTVALEKEGDYCRARVLPKEESWPLKDLDYICRRLNEKQVVFKNTGRVWFSI